MRRSLLFVPATEKMLGRVDYLAPDSIIFDLEDSINLKDKALARDLLSYYLESHDKFGFEVIVRVNDVESPYYNADLEEILSEKVDAIMLPKATVNKVQILINSLSSLEKKKKINKEIKIIPLIELAISILEVEEIAKLTRVDGLMLGAEDLTNDMEVERSKEGVEIEYARSRIIMACKAYQLDAIDTPFTDTKDVKGLLDDCLHARKLGMNAKSCIHPNQITTVVDVFTPSAKLVEWAQRVVDSEKANFNQGAFSVDGKMVDKPIIERAKKIVKKAEKFGRN